MERSACQKDQAIEEYTAAIGADGRNPHHYLRRAKYLLQANNQLKDALGDALWAGILRPSRQSVFLLGLIFSRILHWINIAENMTREGDQLENEGKFSRAGLCLETCLDIGERVFGANSHQYADTLNNLANLHYQQGNYQQAEELYTRSMVIREQVFGANSHQCADTLNNLASLHYQQGNYQQAEELYTKSMVIREQVFGANSHQYADTLNNLASLHSDQGNYQQAEELHTRSLAIREQVFGANSHQYADTLNNLANLHFDQGNYQQAEELHTRSLAIKEQVFGANSHQSADTLHNLANLHCQQGNYQQAEELYTRSMVIKEQVFGANSHQYADALHNYGLLQLSLRCHDLSQEYLGQASNIFLNVFGRGSLKVAQSLCAQGFLHYELGDLHTAVTQFQEALHTFGTLSGVGSYHYTTTLTDLGAMYFDQGHHHQAIECFDRAISNLDSEFMQLAKARALTLLGDIYLEQETFEQAEAYYRQALDIYTPSIHLPDVLRQYVIVLLSMGFLHKQRDMDQQAKKFFRKAAKLRSDKRPSLLISRTTHYQDYDPLDDVRQALAAARREFGNHSIQYAQALRDLAGLLAHRDTDDRREAQDSYQEALMIYTLLEDESPAHQIRLAATHHSLGRLHMEGAVDEFLIALTIYERIHGRNSRQCGMTRAHLAECYLDLHDEDDDKQPDYLQAALENYREALRIHILAFGPNSRQCADIYASLGRLHEEQAQQAEVEGVASEEFWGWANWAYARALRIYKVVLGMDSHQFMVTMEARGRMFERQGQSERGQRMQASAWFVKRQLEL